MAHWNIILHKQIGDDYICSHCGAKFNTAYCSSIKELSVCYSCGSVMTENPIYDTTELDYDNLNNPYKLRELLSQLEEEKMTYEELEADRDDYKKRFKQMVALTGKIKNAFLGEGYYISGSCGEPQASEIIINEIIEKFAPKPKEPKKPNKNWIFNRFGQR